MIPHKIRLAIMVVLAVIILGLLAAAHFLELDADTKGAFISILESLAGAMAVGGSVDAAIVERRRRNTSIPAIRDDERD